MSGAALAGSNIAGAIDRGIITDPYITLFALSGCFDCYTALILHTPFRLISFWPQCCAETCI